MSTTTGRNEIGSGLTVRRLTPRIGAEISGISLSGDLGPSKVTAIRDTILAHKVVCFRGQQHLTEDTHESFGRLLGPIEPHPTAPR